MGINLMAMAGRDDLVHGQIKFLEETYGEPVSIKESRDILIDRDIVEVEAIAEMLLKNGYVNDEQAIRSYLREQNKLRKQNKKIRGDSNDYKSRNSTGN